MKCSTCGYDLPETAKFCLDCGTKLGEIKPAPDLSLLEEKIDRIQRFLPKGLTEKILSQKDKLEGERKHVTVLSCDLVGYTKMASNLDPEETYAIMDRLMERLIHKIHEFGGTVNQLLGDGQGFWQLRRFSSGF